MRINDVDCHLDEEESKLVSKFGQHLTKKRRLKRPRLSVVHITIIVIGLIVAVIGVLAAVILTSSHEAPIELAQPPEEVTIYQLSVVDLDENKRKKMIESREEEKEKENEQSEVKKEVKKDEKGIQAKKDIKNKTKKELDIMNARIEAIRQIRKNHKVQFLNKLNKLSKDQAEKYT